MLHKSDIFFQLNTLSTGFFHTHYSDDMLDALMPAFRPANGCALIRNNSEDTADNKNIVPALEPMDRYGLVVDLFAVDFKFVFESYFKFRFIFLRQFELAKCLFQQF